MDTTICTELNVGKLCYVPSDVIFANNWTGIIGWWGWLVFCLLVTIWALDATFSRRLRAYHSAKGLNPAAPLIIALVLNVSFLPFGAPALLLWRHARWLYYIQEFVFNYMSAYVLVHLGNAVGPLFR